MWYLEVQKKAAEKVAAVMARPMPLAGQQLIAAYERGEDPVEFGDCDAFDPWDIFPSLYGTYSSEFDDLAIEVLTDLMIEPGNPRYGRGRNDLAAQMFQEMLCTAELCEYGSSPRGCWATTEFKPLLPELIEKWEAFSRVHWGGAA